MATSRQKRAIAVMPEKSEAEVTQLLLESLNLEALNDFVLVKPIEIPVSAVIQESDHWKQNPNWATVMAVGSGRVVNGVLIPIALAPGDIIMITKYGETVEEAGVKFFLVHASECKLRRKK